MDGVVRFGRHLDICPRVVRSSARLAVKFIHGIDLPAGVWSMQLVSCTGQGLRISRIKQVKSVKDRTTIERIAGAPRLAIVI